MQKIAYSRTFVPMPKRFWSKVQIRTHEMCWIWTGCSSPLGYGRFRLDGKSKVAPRVAWEIENGPVPDRLFVLHRCDNPKCCNPNHLFLGTKKDNSQDMMKKGRDKIHYKKLTPSDIDDIRKSSDKTLAVSIRLGVHPSTVWKIRTNRSWKHIP
jgi:hypothetical protein